MPVGSSDSTCLARLIGFNLWAVGIWWLQHIKAYIGNNTLIFPSGAWKFCILNKKFETAQPSISIVVAPVYSWWALGSVVFLGFCCMKAAKEKHKSSNKIRRADDNRCLLPLTLCNPVSISIYLPWTGEKPQRKKNKVEANRILEEKKSWCYD